MRKETRFFVNIELENLHPDFRLQLNLANFWICAPDDSWGTNKSEPNGLNCQVLSEDIHEHQLVWLILSINHITCIDAMWIASYPLKESHITPKPMTSRYETWTPALKWGAGHVRSCTYHERLDLESFQEFGTSLMESSREMVRLDDSLKTAVIPSQNQQKKQHKNKKTCVCVCVVGRCFFSTKRWSIQPM